jgi:F-type H+-transporting ATPase subunit delta
MTDALVSGLEATEQDLKRLADIVEAEPLVVLFLDHPLITLAEKEHVLEKAIDSDLTRRLLRVLIGVRKSRRMRDVYDTFADMLRRELAMVEVEVRVPQPLSPEKQETLQHAIEEWVGRRVQITFVVDASVIGGVRALAGGRVADNTLKSQLESIEENLLTA